MIGFKDSAYPILDAVDGKFIQWIRDPGDDESTFDYIAWDDRDTFIIDGTSGLWGAIFFANSLKENSVGLAKGECAHATDALIGEGFKLDLENNVLGTYCVPGFGYDNPTPVSSLTIPLSRDDKPYEGPGSSRTIMSTPFTAPTHWEMIDGLKLTHASEPGTADIKRFVISSKVITPKRDSDIASIDPFRLASRSLETNLSSAGSPRAEQRLHDFNVQIGRGTSATKTTALKLLKPVKMQDNSKFGENFSLVEDQTIEINNSTGEGGSCDYEPREHGAGGTIYMANKMRLMQFVTSRTKLTLISPSCVQGTMRAKYSSAYLHDRRSPGRLFDLEAEFAMITQVVTNCTQSVYTCDIEAELFFDRYLVVWSRGGQAAAIYDVQERKLLHQLVGLPSSDVMQRLSLAQDLKTLVKLDTDGGFQVIALKPAERDKDAHVTPASTKVDVLLSGRIVDDDVVAWTPSGKFDSTAEGASLSVVRVFGTGSGLK